MFFEEVVKKISPTLKRIVQKVNARVSFIDEDDLFQEALFHLWIDFRKGKLQDKTDSYILQGCFFYLKNYLRKTQEKVTLINLDAPIDEGGYSLKENLSIKDSKFPFENAENKMLIEEILDSGLTKREGEVLLLFLEGLTIREMGRRLGLSHTRVIKLKNNIRRKSHKYNEDYAEEINETAI